MAGETKTLELNNSGNCKAPKIKFDLGESKQFVELDEKNLKIIVKPDISTFQGEYRITMTLKDKSKTTNWNRIALLIINVKENPSYIRPVQKLDFEDYELGLFELYDEASEAE